MTSTSQFRQRKKLPREVQQSRFQCFINLYFIGIGRADPTQNAGFVGCQGGPWCSAHLGQTAALSKRKLKAWGKEPSVLDLKKQSLGVKSRHGWDRSARASHGTFAGVQGSECAAPCWQGGWRVRCTGSGLPKVCPHTCPGPDGEQRTLQDTR